MFENELDQDNEDLELHRSIFSNDYTRVEELLADDNLDINYRDEHTGFTPLHCAALQRNEQLVNALVARGARANIPDEINFEARHYMLEPKVVQYIKDSLQQRTSEYSHKFDDILIDSKALRSYIKYRVRQVNHNLANVDFQIVYLHSILEIDEYLESNLNQARIGFIILFPKCILDKLGDDHVLPIYYQRRGNDECFVFIKAVDRDLIPLPESKNPSRKRHIVFSPYLRQVDDYGCFEDALLLLFEMAATPDFILFCMQNSAAIDYRHLHITSNEEKGVIDYVRQNKASDIPKETINKYIYTLIARFFILGPFNSEVQSEMAS